MRQRLLQFVGGTLLLVLFAGLTQTEPGLHIGFVTSWTNATKGEIYFWAALWLMFFPGALLIASSIAPWLRPRVTQVFARADALDSGASLQLILLGGLLAFGVFAVGNLAILDGYPITDDEYAAQLGGRILAMGRVMDEVPAFFSLMPHRFGYMRDGFYSVFDWLGALIPWAISELTYTGTNIFSVWAAVGAMGVVELVRRRLSLRWALVAAALYLSSPMAITLSITSHAHVVSRGALAAALVALLAARASRRTSIGALAGLFAGIAGMTRPLETAALFAPVALALLWDARKDQELRRVAAAMVATGLVSIAITIAHSLALTGTPFPARIAPNEIPTTLPGHHKPPLAFLSDPAIAWKRLGSNIGYNTFMLCVYAFGAVTLPLAIMGVVRDRFNALLGLGIVLALCVGILHDDFGIHIVGPIHYSEVIVPLTVLVVCGLHRIVTRLSEHGVPWQTPAVVFCLAVVATNGALTTAQLAALRRQADIHVRLYERFDDPAFDHSVVLVPNYTRAWFLHPQSREAGSFVLEWRKPDPAFEERVIFIHNLPDEAELMALRDAFPKRTFFQMGADVELPVRILEDDWVTMLMNDAKQIQGEEPETSPPTP